MFVMVTIINVKQRRPRIFRVGFSPAIYFSLGYVIAGGGVGGGLVGISIYVEIKSLGRGVKARKQS